MGLKSISSRHRDIIRRLIVGQTMQEIGIDLGVSLSRISILKADPLFAAEYYAMESRVVDGFVEARASAMEILECAAPEAARLTRDAISGSVDGEEVPQGLRLKSAWDCLDRTGNKAVDKHLVGHVDLAELIGKAYQEKHGNAEGPSAPNAQRLDGDSSSAPNADMSHNPGDVVDGIVRVVGGGNGAGAHGVESGKLLSEGASHPNDCESSGDGLPSATLSESATPDEFGSSAPPTPAESDEDLAMMVMEDYASC